MGKKPTNPTPKIVVRPIAELHCTAPGCEHAIVSKVPFGARSTYGRDKDMALREMWGEWVAHMRQTHPDQQVPESWALFATRDKD